ncbi:PqiA family protein [Neisseria gonorrhoeae]|uniref:PqiA family protein n=1 Tax=Neisseria gonorrhoeae TaxID=485 RepID=A0A378VUC1_NEIGO|nr:PqiA family protein [Neisseria gonorrhoeae]
MAEVMFVLTFGAPVLFLLLCLYVYAALIRKQAYPALRLATRVMVRLRQAMMVDVFLFPLWWRISSSRLWQRFASGRRFI